MEENSIATFSYNKCDLHFKVKDKNDDSNFDALFKKQWHRIEHNNLLRYPIKTLEFKVLEGKYGFCLQLNTERATLRRTPEEIKSMFQSFDSTQFNFMKISNKEIICDIKDRNGNDTIAVNVSPILRSHSLFMPKRMSGLPQRVTLYSLQKSIEILLLSNSVNIRFLFNSLCANASVNHLHWHLYYLDHRMLLEWIPLKCLIDSVYVLDDFPAKGFCIKLSSFSDQDIDTCASYAYKIVNCLQTNEIAHNIYITRSKTDIETEVFDDLRIYIWARAPSYGIKNTKDFVVAACELFGHLPIRSEEAYEYLNEEYISEYLQSVTTDAFESAQKKIIKILQED